jgi:hypothetical protein
MSAGERCLSLSAALAVCVGIAYFGLLHALIGVRVAIAVPMIPHVQFAPVALEISGLPEWRRICIDCDWTIDVICAQPRPPIPPLEIAPISIEMIDERSAREVREFDPSEMIDAYDASTT